MSYRRIIDRQGQAWEIWEVRPAALERRISSDRRRSPRRHSGRRRQPHETRLVLPSELRDGWLAVQGGPSKMRLTPIPDGWVHLSDAELAELVNRSLGGLARGA